MMERMHERFEAQAAALKTPICAFVFEVEMPDGSRRKGKLQGAGGQYGNEILHSLSQGCPVERLDGIKTRLLARARAELEREGSLRMWNEGAPPTQLAALRVLSVRPVYIQAR